MQVKVLKFKSTKLSLLTKNTENNVNKQQFFKIYSYLC